MEGIMLSAHPCNSTLLDITRDGTCSLCFKETSLHYTCNACGFDLCKPCSSLSGPRVMHTIHPQHLLHFHMRRSDEKPQSFICCGCGYVSSGSYYECRECEIKIDLECVSKEITRMWDGRSIFHYSHRHMLSLCRPGPDCRSSCLMCDRDVSDMTVCYGCVYCLCFIHEWCIDLPREIRHPVHPPHPLRRLNYVQHGERKILCNACQDMIYGVPFGCIKCKFNLHIGCADSLLRGLKHDSHWHALFYVAKNASYAFTQTNPCYICKGIGQFFKNCYYRCIKCDLNFHFECLKLPTFLASQSCHSHPLWCKTFDESCDYYCDVCETMINSGSNAYYCNECEFSAHIGCTFQKEEPSPMYLRLLYSCGDEDVMGVNNGSVGETSRGNIEGDELMIVDVTHTHLLQTFDNKEGISHASCTVCKNNVDSRAYRCAFHESRKCKFVAHEACAQLGQQSTRRFHRSHPLTLLPVPPAENMECNMCKRAFETFNLICRTCDYVICLSCARGDVRLVQKVARGKRTCIDGHNLVQFFERSKPVDCSICEENVHGKGSACQLCRETYHDQCLQLLGHRVDRPSDQHRDSLRLVRRSGFRCSDCKLMIRKYGYQCQECYFGSFYHVKCPEASLKVECHNHNLRYSRAHIESDSTSLECNACGRPCSVATFYGCDKCSVSYHVECLGLPNHVKYKGYYLHILRLRHSLNEISRDLRCDRCHCPCDPLGPAYTCEICECALHIECLTALDNRDYGIKVLTGEDRALELRKSLEIYNREAMADYCTKEDDRNDGVERHSLIDKAAFLLAQHNSAIASQNALEGSDATYHKKFQECIKSISEMMMMVMILVLVLVKRIPPRLVTTNALIIASLFAVIIALVTTIIIK